MGNECCCVYPVDIKKARRLFKKAADELQMAEDDFGEYLRDRDSAYQNAQPRGALWMQPQYPRYEHLLAECVVYERLAAFSKNVLKLNLNRGEVDRLCQAERGGFYGYWEASVTVAKKTPFPEPYVPPAEPVEVVTESKPNKGIWLRLFKGDQ